MKKQLSDRKFDNDDDVIAAIHHLLEVQDIDFYKERTHVLNDCRIKC